MGNPNVTVAFTAAAAVDPAIAKAVNSLPYAVLADCVTYRALAEPVADLIAQSSHPTCVAAADAFASALDNG